MIDTQALRAEQLQRASEVIRYDDFQTESPAFIAGADVGFEQEGEVTRAAIAILRYPSLELVEYRVARVATTLPYIPGFYHFVNTLRCSRLGSNCSRSRTWFLSTAMVSHTRAVWALPAISVCWSTYRPLASPKSACAVNSPLWTPPPARWRRWKIKASSLAGCGVARRVVTRCLSLPATASGPTVRWLGYNVVWRATVCRNLRAGPMPSPRAGRPSSAGCSSIQRCRNDRFRVHCGADNA